MAGWHHRFNEHEFEQAPGDSEGMGKAGILQSMRSQRVGYDSANKNNNNLLREMRTVSIYKG